MIPTTAGTGSDVGCWTVVTNTAENYKGFCGGWMCMPKVALLDPEMTVSPCRRNLRQRPVTTL